MTVIDRWTPTPSKHAKSESARDLVHGRGGGRFLPLQSDFEQAEAFAVALAAGDIVYARCRCSAWWVAAKNVGRACRACDSPVGSPRVVLLDDQPDPCPPGCPICESGWAWFAAAIGPCSACGKPCRSTDPAGQPLHPSCTVGPAA